MDPIERFMSKFDITGQGTILSVSAPAASAPSTPQNGHAPLAEPSQDAAKRGRTSLRKPNKKQQFKQAMAVQSAHMITVRATTTRAAERLAPGGPHCRAYRGPRQMTL